MLNFTVEQFNYNKEDRIFVQESSMLNLSAGWWNSTRRTPIHTKIKLVNPKTQSDRVFTFEYADMSGDEAMGWNYSSTDNINLLIIND